ncbi:MAG TPA: NAD(P)H-hydrate dehydratase [Acidimicrobiia bacterium]|jgi:NAD(P)H-hydrate epimerase
MEAVLTPAQMAAIDGRAIASGVSEAALIGRAGAAVAWHARRMLGGTYGGRVVVVCGKGNNGADGRVAAGALARWGAGVEIIDLTDPPNARRLGRALDRCDLAIDAMFGTGFRGELDGAAASIDEELYRAPLILSVDIPSGVDGATGEIRGDGFVGGAVLAHETVTFGAYKPGLLFEPGRFHAGEVTVADIGLPIAPPRLTAGSTVLWTEHDSASAPLERWPQDHKWSSAVVVVGGSPGMTGAPLFAARAAQRCGAGMVVVTAPGVEAANRMSGTEVVVTAVSGSAKSRIDESSVAEVIDTAKRAKAVVVGPGIGRRPGTERAVRSLITRLSMPIVVDADALHAIGTDYGALFERDASGAPPAILTPHDGEYRVLTGRDVGSDRLEAARALASATRCVVLLKGPATVVAGPDGRAAIVANGGSELATAGTGDVLCGVIAALCAQMHHMADEHDVVATVASAAWIHAAAGRSAGMGPSTIASDVVAALPPTLERLRRGEHTT